jgi:hypothetical protein
VTTQSEVNAAIAALYISDEFDDKKVTKSLNSRIKREWLSFKASAINIGFDPEKHRTFTLDKSKEDLWGYVAHDWIMIRNLGFLDGHWQKDKAEKLAEIAKSFGRLEVFQQGDYIFPRSDEYINKIATYCFLKYKEVSHSHLNKDGYGKTSSPYMIKLPEIDNQWRRIYSLCYSNTSTEIITIKGETLLLGNLLSDFCIAVGDTVKINL